MTWEWISEAAYLGAVAYIPSGRCGEVELEPEVRLSLFEDEEKKEDG